MLMNTYKTLGVVYEVAETELIPTKKGSMTKRYLYVEVPTQLGSRDNSEILQFEVLNEDCSSLDWVEKGTWVNVMYRITGRFWVRPSDNKRMHFTSLKLVDVKQTENPFETGKKVADGPDALSPDPVSKLADNVTDFVNAKGVDDIIRPNKDWTKNTVPPNDDLPF